MSPPEGAHAAPQSQAPAARTAHTTHSSRIALLPVLGLAFNALVWGTSWWPFRQLQAIGLHPLWTTVIIYVVAAIAIGVVRPGAFAQVLRTPVLWVLVFAAGMTNAAFNWGVAIGDVVRVVLLFYLMPIWAVLLARWLLGERITGWVLMRVGLALAGAAAVLWPEDASLAGGWAALPLPRSLADWLGVLGGMTFALNNVMLRREAHRSEEGRAMAMFLGGVLVAGALATTLSLGGTIAWPPAAASGWVAATVGLSLLFLASNMALQYGAARLTAGAAAIVMLSEVIFASVSSAWFGDARLTPQVFIGGGLIVAAALLATLSPPHAEPTAEAVTS